jgi:hypothetical protein
MILVHFELVSLLVVLQVQPFLSCLLPNPEKKLVR